MLRPFTVRCFIIGRSMLRPYILASSIISRAWRRVVSVIRAPPSIRAISATRSSPSRETTEVTVRPSTTRFSTRKWESANAATWGRWVIQRTCWPRATSFSFSPTSAEVAPPMPLSTSSNTRVGTSLSG